jgi:hypothetical protein
VAVDLGVIAVQRQLFDCPHPKTLLLPDLFECHQLSLLRTAEVAAVARVGVLGRELSGELLDAPLLSHTVGEGHLVGGEGGEVVVDLNPLVSLWSFSSHLRQQRYNHPYHVGLDSGRHPRVLVHYAAAIIVAGGVALEFGSHANTRGG